MVRVGAPVRSARAVPAAAAVRHPICAAALGQLGGYLTETGHVAEGIRLLEPVANAANADVDSLNALGIPLRGRRMRRARSSSVCSRSIRAAAYRSRTWACSPSSAATWSRRVGSSSVAVRVDPRSSRAYSGLGHVALKSGGRAVAIDAWKRAVHLVRATRRALQCRHGARARRSDERRAAVPRSVSRDRAAGVVCERPHRSRGAPAPVDHERHESATTRKSRKRTDRFRVFRG